MKRRDEQMETLLDRLGEVDFGGRLANDSLGIYQDAHKSMIDANTKIVERVPEQVRILAEEQRVAGERFTTFRPRWTTCSRILRVCRPTWRPQHPSLWSRRGPIRSKRKLWRIHPASALGLICKRASRPGSEPSGDRWVLPNSTVEWTPSSDKPSLVEQMHRAIEREFT